MPIGGDGGAIEVYASRQSASTIVAQVPSNGERREHSAATALRGAPQALTHEVEDFDGDGDGRFGPVVCD